jgi:hypothetical protein
MVNGATANQQAKQLSPQQRAVLFAQATRQNYQTMPTQSVNAENTTIQFNSPESAITYLGSCFMWKRQRL